MRRLVATLLAAALLILMAVPAAAAGKPTKTNNEPLPPELYAAGDVCDFDLMIEYIIDTGHVIEFPADDGGTIRQNLAGHLVSTVTNLENDRSVTYNISGPGKFFITGDTLLITGGGPWLLYAFPGDDGGPGMWYAKGKVSILVDLTNGQWLNLEKPRNNIDVCAVLGGAAAAG